MNDRENKTLALATNEELVEELTARSTAIVLGFLPHALKGDQYAIYRNGSHLLQLGLAAEVLAGVRKGVPA
jgi:hypothetical protein